MAYGDEHWSQGLFDKPIDRVIALFDDDDLSYEFDIYDAVLAGGTWHLVHTSGCSCPSYEEMAGEEFEGTLAQIRDHIAAEYPQPYYDKMRKECLETLDEVLARAQDDDALGC